MNHTLDDLVRDLRALLEMPVATKADLHAWNLLALRVQSDIRSNPELSTQVPHELWHYFADADIRMEDPDYEREQCGLAREFLAELENLKLRVSVPEESEK